LRVTTGDQTPAATSDPPPDKPKVSAYELAKAGQDDLFAGLESANAESELDEELPPEVARVNSI